jgi:hypothetical protein
VPPSTSAGVAVGTDVLALGTGADVDLVAASVLHPVTATPRATTPAASALMVSPCGDGEPRLATGTALVR